jgi:hypothetical protein
MGPSPNTSRKKHNVLDDAQFAIPGQTYNNAVLNKILFFDLSRQSLSPGILSDFDATVAFDRVLAGLSIITCQRVGLPQTAGLFMYELIKDTKFYLITGFGKSIASYSNTMNNKTGQGVLQGSSSACRIFILNSNVSLSAYHCHATGASFKHPISVHTVTDYAVQFVGDTSQFVNVMGLSPTAQQDEPPLLYDHLFKSASKNAQTWADYLWLSGGKLQLAKCFYYALRPTLYYKKNEVSYKVLAPQQKCVICDPSNNTPQILTSLSPDDARRTLGAIISPNGSGTSQLPYTINKLENYTENLSTHLCPAKQSGLL